ncbi:MAG: translation initiation factor Sui1 [Betaproteobacteria bacterium]
MVIENKSRGLVYSTEGGRMCPECRRSIALCVCGKSKPAPATDGVVRVSRETKGRNGKSVTVIRGLALDSGAMTQLGKEIKSACGSGGTVKDGVIEVQGDHVDRVIAFLKGRALVVKRAGG